MGLLAPLFSLVSTVAAAKTGIEAVAPHFFGGGYPDPSVVAAGVPVISDGMMSYSTAGPISPFDVGLPGLTGGGLVGKIAGIEQVVPGWVMKLAAGAGIATAIYEEYKRWRAAGANHKTAKRRAHARFGLHHKRRRMRATNIHALRRAEHRLHAFQRIVRKVHGVLPHRGGGSAPHSRHRRRPRRGDLYFPEEFDEMIEELMDAGHSEEEATAIAESYF
jgi:hypothetical protein